MSVFNLITAPFSGPFFAFQEKQIAADQCFAEAVRARGQLKHRWQHLNRDVHHRVGDGGVYALVGLAAGVGACIPRKSMAGAIEDIEADVEEIRASLQDDASASASDDGGQTELNRLALSFLSKMVVGLSSRAIFTSLSASEPMTDQEF